MNLLERVKSTVLGELTEDSRKALEKAKSVQEMRIHLENIIARNTVESNEQERQLNQLEQEFSLSKNRLRAGGLGEFEKMNLLRGIKRLETRRNSIQRRINIYQDNIDLHTNCLDKIDEAAAMDLKSVQQQQIDELAVDYEESKSHHSDVVAASKAAFHEDGSILLDSKEKKELDSLEQEILQEPMRAPIPILPEPVEVEDKYKERLIRLE
jgi:hypothetical protein